MRESKKLIVVSVILMCLNICMAAWLTATCDEWLSAAVAVFNGFCAGMMLMLIRRIRDEEKERIFRDELMERLAAIRGEMME